MMKFAITAIAAFATMLLVVSPAQAVVVHLHEGGRVVYAKLVRLTPELLTVERISANGTAEQLEFSRSEVAKLTLNVSDARLSELDPAEPAGYFTYAEELFPLRADPDALHTAIRLYLIAGHLNSEQFGIRALEKLVIAARSKPEQRRLQAMLHLLAAQANGGQSVPLTSQQTVAFLESPEVTSVLDCLRALRNGDRRKAMSLLADQKVRLALARFQGDFTANQLEQLAQGECPTCLDGRLTCDRCNGKPLQATANGELMCAICRGTGLVQCTACRGRDFFTRPSNEALRKLLAVELDILQQRTVAKQGQAGSPVETEQVAQHDSLAVILQLDWTNLTELDPREHVYLGDRWVRP